MQAIEMSPIPVLASFQSGQDLCLLQGMLEVIVFVKESQTYFDWELFG